MANLSEVTDPNYLDGLKDWPMDELRSHRRTVEEIETGLSFMRRIVQGRLDIVVAEQHHREHGERADVSDLVDELPTILSDNVHAPGLGRLPTLMGPGELDPTLERRLEEILPAAHLAALPDVSEEELTKAGEELTSFERVVSAQRRDVLNVVDRIQDEIVRRYGTGEATVDSLLP
ncbi:MAG TPA: hypothetical protein VG435_20475 [Acidimicrobiales bacterium]|nr:hypothetical protein [Acidimicrobiales bacterium]